MSAKHRRLVPTYFWYLKYELQASPRIDCCSALKIIHLIPGEASCIPPCSAEGRRAIFLTLAAASITMQPIKALVPLNSHAANFSGTDLSYRYPLGISEDAG
ncbi:hypothetical protein PHLCEN_2v5372 [Hermanssonia centrifuga]|uniref:Uncharacterized protein n=1 Tax=Hermanssonia centrifuga TaxID=98765 RepID=A0A2R6P5E2_9APHY|nr:hypothetical protein PHLCEN_2v5372 [Hermanssonia centrifuga]